MSNSETLSPKQKSNKGRALHQNSTQMALMACVVLDADTKQVLVIAFVNEESFGTHTCHQRRSISTRALAGRSFG